MGWREAQETVNVGVRETFGERDLVNYTHLSGATRTLRAPFSEYTTETDATTNLKVRTQKPNLLVRDADLAEAPLEGDRFTFRGATYSVEEPQPDGTGSTTLFCRKVA